MEMEEAMRELCAAAAETVGVTDTAKEVAAETAAAENVEEAGVTAAEEAVSEEAAAEETAMAEAAETAEARAGVPAAEVERLVEEAYRRGRNESIAELMSAPRLYQSLEGNRQADDAAPETGFLANRRPSIWDS